MKFVVAPIFLLSIRQRLREDLIRLTFPTLSQGCKAEIDQGHRDTYSCCAVQGLEGLFRTEKTAFCFDAIVILEVSVTELIPGDP